MKPAWNIVCNGGAMTIDGSQDRHVLVFNADSRPHALIGTIHDVTTEKEARAFLETYAHIVSALSKGAYAENHLRLCRTCQGHNCRRQEGMLSL